jgi:hypothetical protein
MVATSSTGAPLVTEWVVGGNVTPVDAQTSDALSNFLKAIGDAGDVSADAYQEADFAIIPFGRGPNGVGEYGYKRSSFADIRGAVKGCPVTSIGRLPAREEIPHRISFGVSLGCPNRENKFPVAVMSANFEVGKLVAVYLMPDRPIFIESQGKAGQ